jgi:hypothetical protein
MIAAESAACLRGSRAAMASCSMISSNRAALKLRSAAFDICLPRKMQARKSAVEQRRHRGAL